MDAVPSPHDEHPMVKLHSFLHPFFSLHVKQDEACLPICFPK